MNILAYQIQFDMQLKCLSIIFTLTFFSCAANPKKDPTITKWKTDAPQKLEEFKKVDAEIKEFDKTHGFDKRVKESDGDIFLQMRHIEEDSTLQLTETKKWFNSTLSQVDYISYEKGKITAQYDHIYLIPYDYEVALYYSTSGGPTEYHRNKISELYDSLSLGNNWYYIVTRCNGCGS